MSKLNNLGDFLHALADKLRAKLNTENAVNPQDFEDCIDEVYEAGHDSMLLQSKSVSPSPSAASVVADDGYDGLSSVTVAAVDASVDANITAANIKQGVTVLGVTGTLRSDGDITLVKHDGYITSELTAVGSA